MKKDPLRKEMAHMLRKVKDQMKHVWGDVQNFGVSNEVFMVEVEVIHRLRGDGVSQFVVGCGITRD